MSLNQCDGCRAGAPAHEHDGITYHRMALGDLMICQASEYALEPPTRLAPEDFASLLEREPPMEAPTDIQRRIQLWQEINEYAAACGGDTSNATVSDKRMAAVAAIERLAFPAPKPDALSSAAARIKSLEDVLVAIRAKAASARGTSGAPLVACREIMELVTETLDPCKPWCVGEPGHEGACVPIEEDDRGE